MFGFNQRQSSKKKDEEERRKRGQADRSVQPSSDSKAVAQRPTGAPQRAAGAELNTVESPKGLPKPESPKASRFYTNSEGSTGDGVRPSSARTVATTTPQKGGLPATSKSLGLPAPETAKAPGPQSNNFYTNKEGQTTRGFGTSSSRAVTPAGPRTGTSLVPTEQPASKPGAAPNAPKEPNYKARAEGKARAAKDTANYEAERSAQDKRFKDAKNQPKAETPKSGQGFKKARGVVNKLGKGGAVLSAVPAIMDAAEEDSTARYAERFSLPEPSGDGSVGDMAYYTGLRGLGFASDVGSAMTFGLADQFYRDKQEVDTDMLAAGTGAVGGGYAGNKVGSTVGKVADKAAGFLSRGRYRGDVGERLGRNVGAVTGGATGVSVAQNAMADEGPDSQTYMPPTEEELANQGATQPRAGSNESVGALQPQPQPQPTPSQQPIENNVTRDGNSFSGGVVGQGYTVNGQSQGGPNISGPQSEQNRQAVENLMVRTPEFGEGGGGFRSGGRDRPNFYIGRDSSVGDRAERAALRGASTAYDGAQNGQLTANQLNTLRGIASDNRSDATSRENNRNNNQTRTETAQINQQGQNQRTGANLMLEQSRLEGEQEERGFRVRQARQVENLREQYQAAETEEDRSAIAEQLQILNGDGGEQKGQYKAQMVDVPVDPSKPELGTRQVPYTFDPRTGQWQASVEQQTGPTPNQNHINALKNNPNLAAQFDEWYGPGAAAQYSGAN